MTLEIQLLPLLRDNYAYVLKETTSGAVAVVDPAEAEPVIAALEARGLTLQLILNTHHHPDHCGGNLALKQRFDGAIIAPEADRHRIPGIDRGVVEGDTVAVGSARAKVIAVPGHTSGHVAFWFEEDKALFSGDTLFALGCGRLFEGDAAMMWASLLKLRALPPATRIYCGHEYTASNARFALAVDAHNPELRLRADEITELRRQDQPTIPSTLAVELATNPFLRADQPRLAEDLGLEGADPVAVFAELRRRKDQF